MPPSITSPRSLILITTFAALLLLIHTYRSPTRSSIVSPTTMTTSAYKDWYSRTQPHPSPESFTPSLASLRLLVNRSAQADPEGFTLALFAPDIAVDARGVVLQVTNAEDFEGIVALAGKTADGSIPDAGGYMNTWRIKRLPSEPPFEQMHVPVRTDGEDTVVKVTSVSGYDRKSRELEKPVAGVTELPEVIWELVGLVLEARSGFVRGEQDKEMIENVKAVLEGASTT